MARTLVLLALLCGCSPPPKAPEPPSAAPTPRALSTPAVPEVVFGCTTRRERAQLIDEGGVLRLQLRDASADWESPPDRTLSDPEQGFGDCGATTWTFADTGGSLVLQQGGCDGPDTPPPGPWTGRLLREIGEAREIQHCGASGSVERDGLRVSWRPGTAEASVEGGPPRVLYMDADGVEHTLLSVFGSQVSWAEQRRSPKGLETRWQAVDARTGAPASLRAVVGEEALNAALRSSGLMEFAREPGTTLDALLASLEGGCAADLRSGLLSRFALHHVEDDGFALVLGAGPGQGEGCPVSEDFPAYGITLPTPAALADDLAFADQAGTTLAVLAP